MTDELKKAWQRIFKRRSHYRAVFSGQSGDVVLADLRRFSRYGEPPLVLDNNNATDMYATGMMAGRQDMFSRIINHLHLNEEQVLKLREVEATE